MSRGLAVVLWIGLGVVIWNGFFDLYVSRGAREYGQLRVEHARDGLPEPDMQEIMSRAQRDGVVWSTIYASLVTGAGLGTLLTRRKTPNK